MKAIIAFLTALIFSALATLPSQAQDTVQVRLTNSLAERVDFYVSPPGGAPKFAGSIEAGQAKSIASTPGDTLLFAVQRKQFQKYVTLDEPAQSVLLAQKAKQAPPAALTKKPAKPQAADGSTLVWQYFKFNNANDQGAANAQLVYGIPETDAVSAMALCSSASAKGRIQLDLFADVAKLKNNSAISVVMQGAGGFNRKVPGIIVRMASGEGLEGYRLSLASNDPLWADLQKLASVKYGAGGKLNTVLKLTGVKVPMAKFLKDCLAFAGKTAGPPSASKGQRTSCQSMAGAKSTNDGAPTVVTFTNRTNEYRAVMWLDGDGRPVDYGALESGQSFETETSTRHPWMFTDGPGNCIEIYLPRKGVAKFDLTVPSPGFGDGED